MIYVQSLIFSCIFNCVVVCDGLKNELDMVIENEGYVAIAESLNLYWEFGSYFQFDWGFDLGTIDEINQSDVLGYCDDGNWMVDCGEVARELIN